MQTEELRASLLTVTFPRFLLFLFFVIRRRTTLGSIIREFFEDCQWGLYDDSSAAHVIFSVAVKC